MPPRSEDILLPEVCSRCSSSSSSREEAPPHQGKRDSGRRRRTSNNVRWNEAGEQHGEIRVEYFLFASEEIDNRDTIWYSEQDIDRTIQECAATVAAMNSGIALAEDSDAFTCRGLEYMTPSGFDITSSSLEAVRLVLEEQERQKQHPEPDGDNVVDPAELLACVVASISRHRLRIAHLAAMRDARAVYGDHHNVDQTNSDTNNSNRTRDRRRASRPRRVPSMETVLAQTRRTRGSRGPLEAAKKTPPVRPARSMSDRPKPPLAAALPLRAQSWQPGAPDNHCDL